MKERDYVLATDVRALGCAIAILREVVPTNNPYIDQADFNAVLASLARWQQTSRRGIGALTVK